MRGSDKVYRAVAIVSSLSLLVLLGYLAYKNADLVRRLLNSKNKRPVAEGVSAERDRFQHTRQSERRPEAGRHVAGRRIC